MRRPLAAGLTAALLFTTVACGDDVGSGSSDNPDGLDGVTVTGDFGEQPTVETDEDFSAEDVKSAELVVGDGEEIGDETVVQAKLAVYDNEGNFLQGNFEGEATERIDLSEQAAPWVSELVGAHVGSRVAVAAPVADVLGPQGAPDQGLEPGEPMLFLVDVLRESEPPLDAPKGDAVAPPADAPKVVGDEQEVTALDFGDAPRTPPQELKVIPLIEGEGPEVKQGQQVTVDYFGAVWGKGDKPFDSSFERGQPATFPLTKGSLIDGWVRGLTGVNVGSRVMLIIPPELGYGAQGSGPDIPGDATLVFVIDVLAAG